MKLKGSKMDNMNDLMIIAIILGLIGGAVISHSKWRIKEWF